MRIITVKYWAEVIVRVLNKKLSFAPPPILMCLLVIMYECSMREAPYGSNLSNQFF